MAKITQIAVIQVHGALTPTLYALNEDGKIFERFNGIWKKVELLEEMKHNGNKIEE